MLTIREPAPRRATRQNRGFTAVLAFLALASVAPDVRAQPFRVMCTDGDPACDLDRSCDGVCRMVVPGARNALVIRLRKHRHAAGRRRARVGRHVVVADCLPPAGACKPALTTGCRADMDAGQCAAHDGDFARGGLLPDPSCHCRTADAGMRCTRDGDCQGMCLAPLDADASFRCSAHLTEFGCFAVLDDQGVQHTLCID